MNALSMRYLELAKENTILRKRTGNASSIQLAMSLPHNFNDSEEYFKECILFFEKYNFLYNSPNTNILIDNVLDQINIQDLENINVFDKNIDITAVENDFLKDFLTELEKFQVIYNDFEDVTAENIVEVPLSQKKKHEIIHLSKEISVMCEQSGCDTVVDFGAGLGYLDQQLYETTNYKILAIECNESHYVGAKKRQRKYHEKSINNVKYVKHTINEKSHTKIQDYLQDKYENCDKFCITGLHACGDLTITAINIFLKMAEAKSMVLMPCCYHLMLVENGRFRNFPLSNCLKALFKETKFSQFMGIPFLRLGVHPPGQDDDLEDKVFSLLARAVLELYAYKRGCKIRRIRRKAVKMKELKRNFEAYIHASIQGYTLIPLTNDGHENINENCLDHSKNFNIADLTSIWRQISQDLTFKKAAIFILLQDYLRPIIDNFILYDRLVYINEHGVLNCSYKKIFNENISPRCLALLVSK